MKCRDCGAKGATDKHWGLCAKCYKIHKNFVKGFPKLKRK
jgi:Zn finger protein HypA/HybF involved in hydrogenase expression